MILERQPFLYFIGTMAALAFVMYFVVIVVEPTFDIAEQTNLLVKNNSQLIQSTNELANTTNQTLGKVDQVIDQGIEQNELMIQQNREIIANQNNNTETIRQVIIKADQARADFVYYLVGIINQSNAIGNKTTDLILERQNVTHEILDILRSDLRALNITVQKLDSDLMKVDQKLDNITVTTALAAGRNQSGNVSALAGERTLTTTNHISGDTPMIYFASLTNNETQGSNLTGNISGYLGGPMLTNQSIPREFMQSLLN